MIISIFVCAVHLNRLKSTTDVKLFQLLSSLRFFNGVSLPLLAAMVEMKGVGCAGGRIIIMVSIT